MLPAPSLPGSACRAVRLRRLGAALFPLVWLLIASFGLLPAARAEEVVVHAGLQLSGTVNWEADTMRHYGFDKDNGFRLEVTDVGVGPAAQMALLSGGVDMIVSDWLWVARQRALGKDLVFIPYSTAVGALMVPRKSRAKTLADLKGKTIGVAGGPIDKSWLILRAYATKVEGFDLAGETKQVFAAPPLVYKAALDGDVKAALNFWNFGARMKAAGMKPLIDVTKAAAALGLDPAQPLLGYVVRGEVLAAHPGLADGIYFASRQAKAYLANYPEAFERLKPMMKVNSKAEFKALKAGYIAGIPFNEPVDEAAAGRMLTLMRSLGGTELLGDLTSLPDGVFYRVHH